MSFFLVPRLPNSEVGVVMAQLNRCLFGILLKRSGALCDPIRRIYLINEASREL